jgi:hypothetical protein
MAKGVKIMTKQEQEKMLKAMRQDKEKKGKFWAPPSKEEGTFPIRILPPLSKKNEERFYFNHKVHWVDGTPYECLKQSITDKKGVFHEAQDCPICKFVKKLYNTAERNTEEWKLAGELNAKVRRISRIVVRGKDEETMPEFYEYGPTIFNILYHIMTETDFGIIVDAKTGRDFNLTKVGTGRRSRYETSTPSAKESPIFSDAEDLRKVFENAMKLDYTSLIEFNSLEEMEKALNDYIGGGSEETKLTPSKKVPVKTTETTETTETTKPVNESEEDTNENSEIDDILNEFTN